MICVLIRRMPKVRIEVLIQQLLKTYDVLTVLWAETKNNSHEEQLKKEMDRIERLIRGLEGLQEGQEGLPPKSPPG